MANELMKHSNQAMRAIIITKLIVYFHNNIKDVILCALLIKQLLLLNFKSKI